MEYKTTNYPVEAIYKHMRCPKCIAQLDYADDEFYNKSIRDIQDLDFGFTTKGFQLWCNRHDISVIHIDKGTHDLIVDTSEYGSLDKRNGSMAPLSELKQAMSLE
jgi:hypothetical protein